VWLICDLVVMCVQAIGDRALAVKEVIEGFDRVRIANRDSFRDSFKGLVALEIIFDLPLSFPI